MTSQPLFSRKICPIFFLRGHGTRQEGDVLKASVAGFIEKTSKLLSVLPVRSRYQAKVGDGILHFFITKCVLSLNFCESLSAGWRRLEIKNGWSTWEARNTLSSISGTLIEECCHLSGSIASQVLIMNLVPILLIPHSFKLVVRITGFYAEISRLLTFWVWKNLQNSYWFHFVRFHNHSGSFAGLKFIFCCKYDFLKHWKIKLRIEWIKKTFLNEKVYISNSCQITA